MRVRGGYMDDARNLYRGLLDAIQDRCQPSKHGSVM